MSSFLILLMLLLSSSSHHEPGPYCQASLRVENRQEVIQLISMDVEPHGWIEEGVLRIIGRENALEKARTHGFQIEIEIHDLEAYYSAQMSGRGDFGDYYTYAEAVAEMNLLAATYPGIVTEPESIGVSHEGNIIWAMKVSDNPTMAENEPEVLFTGVHHAREPITCTLCLDFVDYLASGYGADPLCSFLVDNRQLWFVPVVNPDGYLHNESTAPDGGGMWRKNRRDNGDGTFGVDPNRNYPFEWGYDDVGSSPHPSSETYRGPSAGSEPEIQAIMQFCLDHSFTCAQNWHSYWNALLYPWGYVDLYTPDHTAFQRLALEATAGIGYQTGTAWEILYNTNGDANDWMYGEQNIKPKIFGCTAEVGEAFWQEEAIPDHIVEGRQISTTFALFSGPMPAVESSLIDDSQGNQNGRLDPGEIAQLLIELVNGGFSPSDQVIATLVCTDPYVQLDTPTIFSGPMPALSTVQGTPVELSVSPSCPLGHVIKCEINVEGEWVLPDTLPLSLPVGMSTILFVDTDDEVTELRLAEGLGDSRYSFDTWDRPTQGPVPLSVLRRYRAIVWSAGDQNVSSIQAQDRASLAQYLDLGGAMLLSAENYLTSYGSEPFTSDYLHVIDHTTSISISSVHGIAGDPITDGIAMDVLFPGGMTDAADAIVPDAQAAGIFTVDSGSQFTALRYPGSGSSTYRTVFTATPLEALHAGTMDLPDLLDGIIDWLLDSSDGSAPTAVPSLSVHPGGTPTEVVLSWDPAADDVGVMHYRIYQSGEAYFDPTPVLLALAVADTFVNIELPTEPGKEFFWRVTAVDGAWNESPASEAVGAVEYVLQSPR